MKRTVFLFLVLAGQPVVAGGFEGVNGSLTPVFILYFLIMAGPPVLFGLLLSLAGYFAWRDFRIRKRHSNASTSSDEHA